MNALLRRCVLLAELLRREELAVRRAGRIRDRCCQCFKCRSILPVEIDPEADVVGELADDLKLAAVAHGGTLPDSVARPEGAAATDRTLNGIVINVMRAIILSTRRNIYFPPTVESATGSALATLRTRQPTTGSEGVNAYLRLRAIHHISVTRRVNTKSSRTFIYDRVPTPSSVIVSDRAVRCGLHRVKERYP